MNFKITKTLILLLLFISTANKAQNFNDTYTISSHGSINEDGAILSDIIFECKVKNTYNWDNSNGAAKSDKLWTIQGSVVLKGELNSTGYVYKNKLYPYNDFSGKNPAIMSPKSVEARVVLVNGLKKNGNFTTYSGVNFDGNDGEKSAPHRLQDYQISNIEITNARNTSNERIIQSFLDKMSNNQKNSNLNEVKEIIPENNNRTEDNSSSTIKSDKNRDFSDQRSDNATPLESKRLKDANDFVNKQKAESKKYDAALENLGSTLNSQFSRMSSNWAKEDNFRRKINSLSKISSLDASAILKEVNYKIQQINNLYSDKKSDTYREIDNIYAKTGDNKQDAVNSVFSGLGKVISQSSLEKERKEKINNLEYKKQKKLEEIALMLKKEYKPIAESYLEKAKFAVNGNEENYYLRHYKYNTCMIDNALSVILDTETCRKPETKTFSKNNKYSGKEYYKAYQSKKNIKELSKNAVYFLELAIEKEPNNEIWLFEKYNTKGMSLQGKIMLLERLIALSPGKNIYKKQLVDVKNRAELTRQITITLSKDLVSQRPNYNWSQHNNLMRYNEHDNYYFINDEGEVCISLGKKYSFYIKYRNNYNKSEYDLGEDEFNNGLLRVRRNFDRKYGFLNTKGEVAIPFYYEDASMFNEGLAAVKDLQAKRWGFIDTKGKLIISFQYGKAGPFSEGLAYVYIIEKIKRGEMYGKSAYINKNGKIAFDGKFDAGKPFMDGLAIVRKYAKGSFMGGSNAKSYYLNSSGKKLNVNNYTLAYPYKNGYALVKKGTKWAIVDKKGNSKLKLKFKRKPTFVSGIAKVDIGSWRKPNYVYVDETGAIIEKK
ncbi:WG repeat-containing protein [Polaribacter sp. IC073]|uniref:WG repeat-containing protein n=1 Tax=Polaribacter sp. IC073 TaxID=2508540 RepID=UPI0011BFA26C|nr:WG repeat-containing protein [Polaribacter sp. IC073]TXD49207.1 WG repeat-containing protein [Polaribacter sp. IC073]